MIRVALLLLLLAAPAWAVQPDEVLADPVLEARARVISKDLRCLVCRNENIDDSHADLARDLRLLVRERLLAGDTNQEVLDYIAYGGEGFAGFGEYVLLNPGLRGSGLILWLAGPGLLVAGAGIAFVYLRRRRAAPEPGAESLSDAEKARLGQILQD